jgi:hypothetical protein
MMEYGRRTRGHASRNLPFSSNTWIREFALSLMYTRRLLSTAIAWAVFMKPGRVSLGSFPLCPHVIRNLPFRSNLTTRLFV